MSKLTPEQEVVVHHPVGNHARVLAVAGSGKSTTLAHRIKYLIESYQSPPNAMLVLMFNTLARKQFISHLDRIGLPSNLQPPVHTFHSFSFQVINEAKKAGLLSVKTQFWLSDKSEYIWACLKRVIGDLEKTKKIPPDSVDPEQAMQAIGLWKGSLIRPERAGSFMQPRLPLVYQAFEEFRLSQHAITYDDFIPLAVELLENNPGIYRKFFANLQHLVVDEYQDVNRGQQALIELLAGEEADIMVVGDDDQTIYEWRGARPNYILKDFAVIFDNKPIQDYRLSRSFRFGPTIAQSAANVISCNAIRVEKPLIAFQTSKLGSIQIFNGGLESNKALTDEVQMLLEQELIPPQEIVVLSRMFCQMDALECEFLLRGIPYRVDGQEPFYKRKEISALLDYIRLADQLFTPMNDELGKMLLNVINKPSRAISRSLVERLISLGKYKRLSLKEILSEAMTNPEYKLNGWQKNNIYDLVDFLLMVRRYLDKDAGEVLQIMVDWLNYLDYFQKYYGSGETADEKANAVTHFIEFVTSQKLTPLQLLEHLNLLDTTQGRSEEELIVFTTIYRTKGLEFDYVLIPQCDEGLFPYLKGQQLEIFDSRDFNRNNNTSPTLENERRLFYVGITRARKAVLIGTAGNPSRFLEEIKLSSTKNVMELVQRMASGDHAAGYELQSILQSNSLFEGIRNNLLKEYLPDLQARVNQLEIAEIINSVSPNLRELKGVYWAE
jgi:DNA helicase-2/ATP-dependent DNA helicase PcrA